jgi:hypothetical protein
VPPHYPHFVMERIVALFLIRKKLGEAAGTAIGKI